MRCRNAYPKFIQRFWPATLLSFLFAVVTTQPSHSAERIYLDYGYLGRVLPTASLEAFAEDGTVDAELAPYLNRLSPARQQELQRLLSTPLPALSEGIPDEVSDPFVLSQWLHSPVGDIALATAGQLIQTRSRQNGQQALRAAIALAATDPEGLSLINIIRFYPTEGLRLNLPQVLALSNAINTNIERADQLVMAASQQAAAAAATDPAIDYSALPVLADTPRYQVVTRSLMLQDPSRDRDYPVELYQPADLSALPGPIPVLVFSHGYGDTRTHPEIVAAAQSIAAYGFVVATPEHIGSNKAYQDALGAGLTHESFEAMEFINRPLDIRFLLDTLEQQNDTEFQGRLQLDHVGLMGHSFGGYTALAAAGATVDLDRLAYQCALDADIVPDNANLALLIQCRLLELTDAPEAIQQLTDGSLADDRISLVIALSPLSNLFGEAGMGRIQIPVVIVGGAYDIATPIVQEQLNAFQWLTTTQKYFYLAENLSHTAALTRAVLDLVYPRSSDIVERFNASENWLFSLIVTLMIAHGKTYLTDDEAYRPYLTAAYVQTVSVEPTRVHLIGAFSPLSELGAYTRLRPQSPELESYPQADSPAMLE